MILLITTCLQELTNSLMSLANNLHPEIFFHTCGQKKPNEREALV